MSVLKRIRYIVKGKTEEVLERLEDPEHQLAAFVDDLNDQMRRLQKAVAGAIADEKRLKMEIEDHLTQANEWESRAVLALEAGNEDLAKEALAHKEEHDARALSQQKTWKNQQAATAKLKSNLQVTKDRMAEAKRKYTLLLAQYKTAETNKKVHDTLSSTTGRSPAELVDKLSDKIRKVEAETEAALELTGEAAEADLESKFAELERTKRGDQALDQLKAKLAGKSSQSAAS